MVKDSRYGLLYHRAPKLFIDLMETTLASSDSRELSVKVANDRFGHARVVPDQFKQLLVDNATFHDFGAGKHQAFLVNGRRIKHVTRILGTEIHPMPTHAQVCDWESRACLEYRRCQDGVISVGRTPVRVIEKDGIARLEPLDAHVVDDPADAVVVRTKKRCSSCGLGH